MLAVCDIKQDLLSQIFVVKIKSKQTESQKLNLNRPDAFSLSSVWHLSVFSFPRTAWVQKIKAASELYIETEKKKREKAYLGNASLGGAGRCLLHSWGTDPPWLGLESLELEDGPGGRGEACLRWDGGAKRSASRVQEWGGRPIPGARKPECKERRGPPGHKGIRMQTGMGKGSNRNKARCVDFLPLQSVPKGQQVSEG